MLSEEALILVVVAGACMLLVLGVLELLWPSRRRKRAPRVPAQMPPARPVGAVVFPRPAENIGSWGPTRFVASSHPTGEAAFPPPASHVAPARRLEDVPPRPTEAVALPAAPSAPTGEAASPPPAEHLAPAPLPEPVPPHATEDAAPPRPPEHATPAPATEPTAPPPRRRRRRKISPHARPHRLLRGQKAEADRDVEPATTPPAPSESPVNAPAPSKPRRDSPVVETCFALYQEKRFGEVVSIGEETLANLQERPSASSSPEAAALWSVLGRAKQALGDDAGAHAALESSIDAAPETERATYRRHLATLALDAAQARLARAGSHDTGDRVAVVRAAIAWTERGLAAAPADPALTDAREAAHEALWGAYEQAVAVLVQRQEFHRARLLLREVLDDPALPAARAAEFRGLLAGTFGGEIGQLTAQAILCMQEARESEALASLQRAEKLLETIPAEALPQTRREEVDQRLWWGYAELGSRRLEAGDYEGALDPLVHALRFDSIGADRRAETRAAIVRALEGIAAVRALAIRRLADADRRDEAVLGVEQLRALVKRCLDAAGLTQAELVAALARVRRLCEELGIED